METETHDHKTYLATVTARALYERLPRHSLFDPRWQSGWEDLDAPARKRIEAACTQLVLQDLRELAASGVPEHRLETETINPTKSELRKTIRGPGRERLRSKWPDCLSEQLCNEAQSEAGRAIIFRQ